MRPTFHTEQDGTVSITLDPGWGALQEALLDTLGTRPPRGDDSPAPSTYWLDRTLARVRRHDGSRTELSNGNEWRLTIDDQMVVVSSDYDTFTETIDLWRFEMLLSEWRRATLEAASQREHAYEDEYGTCARTHATLRVFALNMSADAVSYLLGHAPSRSWDEGDQIGRGRIADRTGWFLSSESQFDSRDVRRHVDFLLDAVNLGELASLAAERGAQSDVFCYWESMSGHGGPSLEPGQMARLVRAGIPIAFDCYFPSRQRSQP